MVLDTEITRAGQSKQYNFTLDEDLSAATEIRIYYKMSTGSGYWDLTTGVTLTGTTLVKYTHHVIPAGTVTLDVWAKWGNSANFIRVTEEPIIYSVTAFPIA